MSKFRQYLDEYNRYKQTPNYERDELLAEMKRIEMIAKAGLVDERGKIKLRKIWKDLKITLDKLPIYDKLM